jgi:hypothetical protein
VLTKEKTAITQFTDLAPLALSDLGLSYDPASQTLDTKGDLTVPLTRSGPAGALCQVLTSLGLSTLLGSVEGCHAATTSVASGIGHTVPSLSDLLRGRP